VSSSRTPAGKKKGPAGSLAWASDRAGPLGPAQPLWAELDPAQKIIIK